jgi:ureidoacrylate peracid hydrolase
MATFPVDPTKTALLVVDLQRCFVEDSPVAAPDGPAVVHRLNGLAAVCRELGVRVIHTRHVVRPDHSNAGLLAEIVPAVAHGVIDDGNPMAEMHPDLDVGPGDIVLAKPRFGAFHGTDLETILRAAGIDTLIIGGIATNMCVDTTAREAAVREFHVLFLRDGSATLPMPDAGLGPAGAAEVQRVTCSTIAFGFGEVLDVEEAVECLESAVQAAAATGRKLAD